MKSLILAFCNLGLRKGKKVLSDGKNIFSDMTRPGGLSDDEYESFLNFVRQKKEMKALEILRRSSARYSWDDAMNIAEPFFQKQNEVF